MKTVLQARNPTEHRLLVKEMRSAEKPFPFGKVNEHERTLPSMVGTHPQHSNWLELEMLFLRAESDRWVQQHQQMRGGGGGRLALSIQPSFRALPWESGNARLGFAATTKRPGLLLGREQRCGKHGAARAKSSYLQNPLHLGPSSVCCPATASACLH